MKIFHKHKFQKDEKRGILWCECGKIKILPKEKCNHKWEIQNSTEVIEINKLTNAKNQFTIQVLICKNCGDIKFLNLTKGEEIKNENIIL